MAGTKDNANETRGNQAGIDPAHHQDLNVQPRSHLPAPDPTYDVCDSRSEDVSPKGNRPAVRNPRRIPEEQGANHADDGQQPDPKKVCFDGEDGHLMVIVHEDQTRAEGNTHNGQSNQEAIKEGSEGDEAWRFMEAKRDGISSAQADASGNDWSGNSTSPGEDGDAGTEDA